MSKIEPRPATLKRKPNGEIIWTDEGDAYILAKAKAGTPALDAALSLDVGVQSIRERAQMLKHPFKRKRIKSDLQKGGDRELPGLQRIITIEPPAAPIPDHGDPERAELIAAFLAKKGGVTRIRIVEVYDA